MATSLPLLGIRVHLSGAIHDNASTEQAKAIRLFVQRLSQAVFREGGTIIHGSHPTLQEPLENSAKQFVQAGGRKDALTFVRAQKYAVTAEQLAEIEKQREYAAER